MSSFTRLFLIVGLFLLTIAGCQCGTVPPPLNDGETKADAGSQTDSAPCKDGETRFCYTGPEGTDQQGVCRAGKQTCTDGKWEKCSDTTPKPEKCNGKDDDCDGKVDNLEEQKCSIPNCLQDGILICKEGKLVCNISTKNCNTEPPPKEPSPEPVPPDEPNPTDAGPDTDEPTTDTKPDNTEPINDNQDSGPNPESQPDEPSPTDTKEPPPDTPPDQAPDKKQPEPQPEPKQEPKPEPVPDTKEPAPEKKEPIPEPSPEPQPDIPQCICPQGSTRSCYIGDIKQVGVGICSLGSQTCNCKSWSPCYGMVLPRQETCDGRDEDCDGKTDENFPNLNIICYAGTGECKQSGKFVCKQDGTGTTCNATPGTAKPETCNKRDDDCDGQVDEGLQPKSCYTGTSGTSGKGLCKNGLQYCQSGRWSRCIGEVTPQAELCNKQDDNCDGQVDNIPKRTCPYTGPVATQNVGLCKPGTQSCTNGQWTQCSGEVLPTVERCDNKDNDCNGAIDNGFSNLNQNCTNGLGVCTRSGKFVCKNDGSGTYCNAVPGTKGSETCNTLDDDCDGTVDEGTDMSKTGTICQVGTAPPSSNCGFVCQSGSWACKPKSTTQIELCNDQDDDCDGQLDEGTTTCRIEGSGYVGPSGNVYGYFFNAAKQAQQIWHQGPNQPVKFHNPPVNAYQTGYAGWYAVPSHPQPKPWKYFCVWIDHDREDQNPYFRMTVNGTRKVESIKVIATGGSSSPVPAATFDPDAPALSYRLPPTNNDVIQTNSARYERRFYFVYKYYAHLVCVKFKYGQ